MKETKDGISDDSSAKLVDRVRIELDAERRRLDVHQGLQAMTTVTGRFSCRNMPREKSPNYYDVHTLVACIEFTNALKMQNRAQ